MVKRIGIIVNSKLPIFSSGMIQHAYFLKQTIENIGFSCDFLTIENTSSVFGYKDIPIKQLSMDETIFNPSEYCFILTFSASLLKDEYNMMKKVGASVVSYITGNHLYQDESTFLTDGLTHIYGFIGKTCSDELWILPHFMFQQKYLETVRGRPSHGVPMLWSNEIIEEIALKTNDLSIMEYNPSVHISNKMNILITEPNLFFVKNAWFPIVTCEHVHTLNPSLLEETFVFNWPETKTAQTMIDKLSISNKVRKFKRLPMVDILKHFNKALPMPIFVSYAHNNGLNYNHYECLYYGYPLVHNSVEIKDYGYYYEGQDMEACGKAILYALTNHNNHFETYIQNARSYLETIHPNNAEIKKTYSRYIQEAIANYSSPM